MSRQPEQPKTTMSKKSYSEEMTPEALMATLEGLAGDGGGAVDAGNEAEPLSGGMSSAVQRADLEDAPITVHPEHMDAMASLTEELVLRGNRLLELNRSLLKESGVGQPLNGLDAAMRQVGLLSGELHEMARRMRMVPVRRLVEPFDLVMENGDLPIDRELFDQINEAVTYLIRCVVEGAAAAESRGKMKGAVACSAEREGNLLVLKVICRSAVHRDALAKIASLKPDLARVNAHIDCSARRKGVEVTIQLPVSPGIIAGLEVGAGEERFIIPLESIVETAETPLQCPTIELSSALNLQPAADRSEEAVVLVESGERRVGNSSRPPTR